MSLSQIICILIMRRHTKFCQTGSNFDSFFDGRREYPKTTKIWPSSANQRNWRADDGSILNVGLVAL